MSNENILKQLQPLVIDIEKLSFDPSNARMHSQKNIEAIKKSLTQFGQRKPIVVQKDGMIVRAGNGTMSAAMDMGWKKIAAIIIDEDNDSAVKYAIADNRTAELADWDIETLLSHLDGMDEGDKDLLEFSQEDVEELMAIIEPTATEEMEEHRSLDQVDDELGGVSDLKNDVIFPTNCKFGIPELRDDMLAPFLKGTVKTWCGPHKAKATDADWWLWPWMSTSLHGMPDMAKVIPIFYVDDTRFENLWSKLSSWTKRLLNAGVKYIVQPNYTLQDSWPLSMNLWQMYRNRCIARYFQEAGLKVFPDYMLPIKDKDGNVVWNDSPKNAPCMMMQMHAYITKDDIDSLTGGLLDTVRKFSPKSLIIYGNDIAKTVVAGAGLKIEHTVVETRNAIMFSGSKKKSVTL